MFCMDTHAIYWRRIGSKKLSGPAGQIFDDGVNGNALLIVPHIVVAELFYLLEKHGRIGLFAQLLGDLQHLHYYRLEPLALADLAALSSIPEIPEMHDRLIALAAKRLDIPVVTKDKAMHACSQIRCIW